MVFGSVLIWPGVRIVFNPQRWICRACCELRQLALRVGSLNFKPGHYLDFATAGTPGRQVRKRIPKCCSAR
jgi:hypothetical protein